MLAVKDLLNHLKYFVNTDKIKKELIATQIKKTINIDIPLNNISFSKNIILLKIPPILKTEILLHKEDLLKNIKEVENIKYFIDIK